MRRQPLVLVVAIVVGLAALSTVAVAAATRGFGNRASPSAPSCSAPSALRGSEVTVTVSDMSHMMNGGMMLGEASQSCGPGSGDGIQAGTVGWVTLHPPTGRYELICNEPWHYGSGMHAELDVS